MVPEPSREVVFSASGLSKRYRMGEVDVHALRGVDLEVREGELVVLRVLQESEGPVTAGAPLMEVGDPSEAVLDLLTTQAVRVKTGAPVEIEQWGRAQGGANR